ncbi:MAG TPA: hypothetical protein PLF13_09085 [candidate division Zixibacteria bacterium]|nr:hypothetical protein [candidate division Zixibacteria bacterium]
MRLVLTFIFGAVLLIGCSAGPGRDKMLRSYALDDIDGLEVTPYAVFDSMVSYDGHGSIRITTDSTVSVPLLVVNDLHLDETFLVYQAALRTQDITGKVYLEMWCGVDGAEYFSRDLGSPLSGSNDWAIESTPFRLEKGQVSELIRLNLVVEGGGTVWIDDIELLSSPL